MCTLILVGRVGLLLLTHGRSDWEAYRTTAPLKVFFVLTFDFSLASISLPPLILGRGYESADDWAALLAAGLILYNAYLILRPALGEVMDE
jgi:hypothetical protein